MKRREFVHSVIASSVLTTTFHLPTWAGQTTSPGEDNPAGVLGQADWRFRQVKDWGVQDPKQVPIRNLHEMVQDAAGLIYVLGDHPQNNILVYRPNGQLVRTMLTGLKGGHGLSLSREQDTEYLWVTNTDGSDAFVRKLTLDGETVLEIRRPSVAPYDNPKVRYLPTEVDVNPTNGDIYVADGYGASVLARYDKSGKLLDIYGHDLPTEQRYNCMHGVRLDWRNPKQPLLWLTSRKDQEIRLVTLDGQLKQVLRFPGVGPCRASFVGENVVIPIIWEDAIDGKPMRHGFVCVLDANNQPVSLIGGQQLVRDNGKAHMSQQNDATVPFVFPHDVLVDRAGDLYVAQWNSGQTYPLKLERV